MLVVRGAFGRTLLAVESSENGVARAERLLFAVAHHRHQVDFPEQRHPVRDDDHYALALAHAGDRGAEGRFAFRVEVRIRLIKHEQERIAIERPGESDALALSRGKHRAAFAHRRVVAFRQT